MISLCVFVCFEKRDKFFQNYLRVLTHLKDCIIDNLSGAIAKQEMTSCPRERYTRGLHCHIIFVMQYQAPKHHANCKQNVFSGRIESHWYFVGSFGSFWLVLLVVSGGFRWFWLVLAGFGWFHVLVTTRLVTTTEKFRP